MTKIPKEIETSGGHYNLENMSHDEVPGDEPHLRVSYRDEYAHLEIAGTAMDVIAMLDDMAAYQAEYKDVYR